MGKVEVLSERSGLARWVTPRHVIYALLVFALCSVIVVWAQVTWVWSPVDDAGHVLALRALVEQHGLFGGMAAYAQTMFTIDLEWGLFRPSYWAYPSLFYLLEPGPAHLVRLFFAVAAIGGPLLYFFRNGLRGPKFAFAAVLLMVAGSALYSGLFLVSLQELSGAALVGLGLAFRNRWLRWVLWLAAAWFKAPFAWLLIGQALVDWHQGRRRLAIANGSGGLLTLGIAFVMSRAGSYTAAYGLDPYLMWFNAQNLLEPQVVLLPLMFLWWIGVTQGGIKWSSETVVFGVAWVGYTAQLLPWSVTAYYTGPIAYFLGLFLISILGSRPKKISAGKTLVALSIPVILGTVLVANSLILGFRINSTMATFQECLQGRPGTASILQGNLVYVTSSPEAPIRLVQNLQLADASWTGEVALAEESGLTQIPTSADLLLNADSPLDADMTSLRQICGDPRAQVYAR